MIQAPPAPPLFSVIIPLEYHRDRWEECWRAWKAQTADRSIYEIILIVPPSFGDSNLLQEFSSARLEFSSATHDMGLCVDGAARARGKYLIFTESHCWPEPDVIERCQEAIDAHPDWAGFSCRSMPTTHNRLSEAEAAMYMADIEFAMETHPWRKILDHCFVTSREAYERCGGFRSEFGHFAEWLLAASYFRQGYKLGYFPKARFHHYYAGSLSDLKKFTFDFVAGEISYFGKSHGQTNDGLFEPPSEWMRQGNLDRRMSRAVLNIAVQWDGMSCRHWARSVIPIGRWILPAISGDGTARVSASAAAIFARICLLLSIAFGSRNWLRDRFRKYIGTLIHAQRLSSIATLRRPQRDAPPPGRTGLDVDAPAMNAAGFYPIEHYGVDRFQWSETAAALIVSTFDGPQKISIECIPVRDLSDAKSDFRFYADGMRIGPNQLSIEANRITIALDVTRSRALILGWTCLPFIAVADSRRLGLPVKRIELIRNSPGDFTTIEDCSGFTTAVA
jgi:Glycosyl transferase family 2